MRDGITEISQGVERGFRLFPKLFFGLVVVLPAVVIMNGFRRIYQVISHA